MFLLDIFDSDVFHRLTITLGHFLWQGFVIGTLAMIVSVAMRGCSSQARYNTYSMALGAMVLCIPVTLMLVPAVPHYNDSYLVDNSRWVRLDDAEQAPNTTTIISLEPVENQPIVMLERVEDSEFEPVYIAQSQSEIIAEPVFLSDVRVGEPSRNSVSSPTPYIMLLYVAGLFGMTLRLAMAINGGWRLARDSVTIDDTHLLKLIARAAESVGLRRVPCVAYCRRVAGPVVVGVFRPMVLLPVSLATGVTPDQFELILKHEFAHIRRLDFLALLLQRVAETILFFHPAVWLVSRWMSVERENCCDDLVTNVRQQRLAYAEALLRIAELRLENGDEKSTSGGASLSADGGNPSRLRVRIARLIDGPVEPAIRIGRVGVLVLMLGLSAMIASPFALQGFAQNEPKPKAEKKSEPKSGRSPDEIARQEDEQARREALRQKKLAEEALRNAEEQRGMAEAHRALMLADHYMEQWLIFGSTNDTGALIESTLSELHHSAAKQRPIVLRKLISLSEHSKWPRKENESTVGMLSRIADEFENREDNKRFFGFKKQYVEGIKKPWPYDWRSQRKYWLELAAAIVDSRASKDPAEIWKSRIMSDSNDAWLVRQGYLAVVLTRPVESIDFEILSPLARQQDTHASIRDLARIVTAALRRGIKSDDPNVKNSFDRLVELIKRHPPNMRDRSAKSAILSLSGFSFEFEKRAEGKKIFDVALAHLKPQIFKLFCDYRSVPLTTLELRDAFFRKPTTIAAGELRVSELIQKLDGHVALPMWIDDGVWENEDKIELEKAESGPWLKVAERTLAKTPYRLVMLSEEMFWIGPPKNSGAIEAIMQRSRGKTPATRSDVGAALRETTQMEFIETPLADVCEYLQDRHGVLVHVGDDAFIGRDTPITLVFKDLPLHLGLTVMTQRHKADWASIYQGIFVGSPDFISDWRRRAIKHRFEMAKLRLEPSKVVAKLSKETKLDFIETPLEDVAKFLSDVYEVDVQFVGPAASIKVNKECPVTLMVSDVDLAWALTLMLAEHDLEWTVRDEKICIGFEGELGEAIAKRTDGNQNIRTISITVDGKLQVDGKTTTLGDLEKHLGNTAKVVIRSSAEAKYERVIELLDKLNAIGIEQVAIAILDGDGKVAAEAPKVAPKKKPANNDGAQWGHFKGCFVVNGDVPDPRNLHVNANKAVFGDVKFDTSLLIDRKSHGLANVLVYAVKVDGPVHPDHQDARKREVELSFSRGMFEPRVVAIQTGQSLKIKNTDPVAHDFFTTANANKARRATIPAQRQLVETFDRQEDSPIKLGDRIHAWERGWLLVRDNPYFAVTDKDGNFEIRNLPVGEFEFRVWHERLPQLGAKTAEVKIRPRSTTDVGTFEIGVERFETKPQGAELLPQFHEANALVGLDPDGEVASITMSRTISDELLGEMKKFPKLRFLYIEVADQITEQGLKNLGELSSLETLQMYLIPLKDEWVAHLTHLMGLRNLQLQACGVGDAGLASITKLPGLEKLNLSGNEITDRGLANLSELSNLVELELGNTSWMNSRMKITDQGLKNLAGLTKMQRLNIQRLEITNHGLAHLARMNDMRELTFSGTTITSNGLRHLENFPKIETLHLRGLSIDDETMVHIGKCKNLRVLTLMYTPVGDEGMKHIANLGRLERLSLSSRHVTDRGLAHLTPLMNLLHLELRCSNIGDEALKHVSKIQSLRRIDLDGAGLPGVHIGKLFSTQGIAQLQKLDNLSYLWLTNMEVDRLALKDFKRLDTLTMMMVSMTQDEVRQLQKDLSNTRVSATWGGGSVQPLRGSY